MTPGKLGAIAGALCALVAGAQLAAAGRAEPTSVNAAAHPPQPLAAADLTQRQLAGQRIVCGFDGRRAPASLLRVIAAGELAGVILFEDNIGSKRAVRRMTAAIQATDRPLGLRQPVIVSIDQEGGQVKRIPGPPSMSAAEMGARGAALARGQGAATGRSLRSHGINVDLAPVLDVARAGGFIADQQRAFGSKAGRVGTMGSAFAEGLEIRGRRGDGQALPRARIHLGQHRPAPGDHSPLGRHAEAGGRSRPMRASSRPEATWSWSARLAIPRWERAGGPPRKRSR